MPITIYIYIPEWEVKDRIEAAVLAEREAIAKLFDIDNYRMFAAAIRARGEK